MNRLRTWLGIAEPPSDEPEEEEGAETENAKAIAALAYQRYGDDLAQRRDIESRAMTLLSLLSAASVFVIGALKDSGACLTRTDHLIFYGVIIVGMVVMFVGLFNLLLVLTTQGFVSPDLDDWVTPDYTRRGDDQQRDTYEEIAGSYRLYSEQNTALVLVKLARFNRALLLIFLGIAIIVIDYLWAGCGLPRLW